MNGRKKGKITPDPGYGSRSALSDYRPTPRAVVSGIYSVAVAVPHSKKLPSHPEAVM